MEGKSLSVIVPIYNVQKYLEKCIESIENQTIDIHEVILVDDGSTDNCGRIADNLAKKWDNIKVIHKKNGGLSSARNSGIDAASGDIITFVDSDDYIESNMYEFLIKQMVDANADISIGGVWYEQENGEKYTPYPADVYKVWKKEEALIELNSYRYFNMSFCDAIFKKSLFDMEGYGEGELRFPLGKLSEDQYLMHKIVARSNIVAYSSKPFYHYIQRENSISRNIKINMGPIGASLAQLDFYEKWFPDLAYIAESACVFSHILIYNSYIRQGKRCPKELLKDLKKVSKKYLKSVVKNSYIPMLKKFQAIAFCYCIPIYNKVVKKRKHR